MNYASTSNIGEVIKFYNLGDKTVETNFNSLLSETEEEMVIANFLHPDTEYKVLLTSPQIVASESVEEVFE